MERLFVERQSIELIVRGELLQIRDRDVELEVHESEPHLIEVDKLDVDRGGGVFGGEQAIDEAGNRHAHRHRRDPEMSMELAAHDADLLDHRLAIGDDALRPLQHPPAFLRESLKPSMTQDDRHADLFFKMLDGAGQGGLGHVASGRRPSEVAFLLQRDQVLKLPQKHGGVSVTVPGDVRIRFKRVGF